MQDSLAPQDSLYTLVERDAGETVSVIGSLADVVFAGDSTAALLDAIDRPEIRIVSLTVTEHGYCLNRSTKRLDPEHPLIRAGPRASGAPSSAIGIIVEAFRRRRAAGAAAVHRAELRQHPAQRRRAARRRAGPRAPCATRTLAAWIAANVSFPSTMVDRITPVTAEADIAHAGRTLRHRRPLAGVLRRRSPNG